jgi:hypothetical protein
MRGTKWLLGMVVAAGMSLVAGTASAAPSISLLNDSGTLRVTTYSPSTQVATAPLGGVYGTSPLPTITPISNGWKIVFTPGSQFFASANNAGGGKTAEMDGQLTFTFTADSAFNANVSLLEDGIAGVTGNGTVKTTAGLVVTNPTTNEAHGGSTSVSGVTNSLGTGTWSLTTSASGFSTTSTTYRISVDNTLLAESLGAQAAGSAYTAKKDFTIIITTIPEPASLGVLALGSLGLLARRRKA